ncbi:hypothetical protein ON010_g1814 [Phytophthora cinnamomi]|nr:hypothetical protein ON010_g1814 [Phytophthora cinnamomi]
MVPTVIAAYDIAMNGVDRVDQLRSTNPTRRKEMRVSMRLLTWVLDLSVINAFALMKHIETKEKPPKTLREFKRRVCESLTSSLRSITKRKEALSKRFHAEPFPSVSGVGNAVHVLTPNSRENSSAELVCRLYSLQGIKNSKSSLGCVNCKAGYHVACFVVAHHKNQFDNPTPSVAKALQALHDAEVGQAQSKTHRRLNSSTTSLETLTLPN